MSDVAIRVEKLGKLYRIGREERYRTLRDTLVEGAQGAVRAVRGLFSRDGRRTESPPTIWALKDVSFEVKRGEVLGIIGRNGAGKTTLLKILSRVTEPTEGYAEIRGRVGSLLEVGTGFHPELTGRENIYLYGAILGMKKAEIQRKFDEIVAFAEVEKFIDTPVKHYSSGMYLRLAFAVAAHLEPEILLVDEVLAVGDAQFQKKCLGKMGDVAGEGRTVLFVSHNMAAVEQLCRRALLLDRGTMRLDGPAQEVVTNYVVSFNSMPSESLATRTDRKGRGALRLVSVEVRGGPNLAEGVVITGGTAEFVFRVSGSGTNVQCDFAVYDAHRYLVLVATTRQSGLVSCGPISCRGLTVFACRFPEFLLTAGRYTLDVALLAQGQLEDHVTAAASFEVQPGLVRGQLPPRRGRVCLPHVWSLQG